MKRSNRLLILVGVFLAVLGFMGAVLVASGGGGSSGPTPVPSSSAEARANVVVAKTNIALGDNITAGMVDLKSITLTEKTAIGDTFTTTDEVVGKVAGGAIPVGTVLESGKSFLSPGSMVDGQGIASALAAGKVGVSIEVDQINGVGTLVVLGDRVDIILSVYSGELSFTNAKNANGSTINVPGAPDPTVKMLIQNKKVLATLLPPVTTVATTSQAAAGSSAAPVAVPSSAIVQNTGRHMIVILEVDPQEAEVIRWAQRAEKSDPQNYISLDLALRSPKDNDAPRVDTTGITYKQLVEAWGLLPPDARGIIPADVAKGIKW